MGRYLFHLPDVGEGVAEAEVVAWHVAVGDVIKEDQSLVDVMTDKATVDMTSPVAGRVVALQGDVGAMLAVGSVLVELEVEGAGNAEADAICTVPAASPEPAPAATDPLPPIAPASPPTRAEAPTLERPVKSPITVKPAKRRPEGEDPLAAPATRRRAYERGVALQFVPGTGPGGRITPEDLDSYIASGEPAAPGPTVERMRTGEAEIRVVGLRRKIAEKMQESKRRIPHFTYVEECDLTELEALRLDLNDHKSDDQPKLTLLSFLMRAMVRVLPEFPQVNARYDDEAGVLHTFEGVHIGIATQTPGGLIVPVIRHAETLDLWESAAELGRITRAAREGKATREELSGSTITLTSLGAMGGISATPVINHPEVAILGPNKLVQRSVVQGGHVNVRTMMNLSSSFDHRIVDGYDAASFIQRLKRLIEHPALIFMDAS